MSSDIITNKFVIDRINALLDVKNISKYRLAASADIDLSTLLNLLERKSDIRISTLIKICDGFGITIAQFFSVENNFPDLSHEQISVLKEWSKLSDEQQRMVKTIISGFKK